MEERIRFLLRVIAEDLREVSLARLVSCIRIQDRGSIGFFLRVVADDFRKVSLAWLVSCIRIQDRGSISSFDFFPIAEELQRSMGIAESILGVLAVTDDKVIVASFLLEFAGRLESRLDQAKLFSAILNRPVAASLANDFKLLEQGALVPL